MAEEEHRSMFGDQRSDMEKQAANKTETLPNPAADLLKLRPEDVQQQVQAAEDQAKDNRDQRDIEARQSTDESALPATSAEQRAQPENTGNTPRTYQTYLKRDEIARAAAQPRNNALTEQPQEEEKVHFVSVTHPSLRVKVAGKWRQFVGGGLALAKRDAREFEDFLKDHPLRGQVQKISMEAAQAISRQAQLARNPAGVRGALTTAAEATANSDFTNQSRAAMAMLENQGAGATNEWADALRGTQKQESEATDRQNNS